MFKRKVILIAFLFGIFLNLVPVNINVDISRLNTYPNLPFISLPDSVSDISSKCTDFNLPTSSSAVRQGGFPFESWFSIEYECDDNPVFPVLLYPLEIFLNFVVAWVFTYLSFYIFSTLKRSKIANERKENVGK